MSWRGGVGLVIALVAGLAVPVAPAGAGSGSPALPILSFRDAPQLDGPAHLAALPAGDVRRSLRHRFVEASAAGVERSLRSPRFDLTLFDGMTLPVTTTSPLRAGAAGSLTWSGRIDAAAGGGDAVATITGSAVRINVRSGGSSIDLRPAGDGRYLVAQQQTTYPREAPPVIPPGPGMLPSVPAAAPHATAAADAPVIKVLTVYEDTALAYYGSDQAAVAEITATINETNDAYANSGITQTIASAGIVHLSYTSSGAAATELDRLTNADGFIDQARTLRESNAADLVILVTTYSDACGIAWLFNRNSNYGYATVDASCARDNLSYAHELGHTMGAGHGNGDGGGYYTYSNGYRDPTNGFRTIMAYDSGGCCPRVRQFSSLTKTYNGFPAGSGTADNASTLNATAEQVAAFRSPGNPPGSPRSVSVKSGSTKAKTGSLIVSFLPALSNGGLKITAYWANCTAPNGSVHYGQRATSPITVTGLTTGKRFTCTASAENSKGFGHETAAPFAVIVGAPARIAAPKITKAGSGSAKVTFTTPANNGAAITAYSAKCTSANGGKAKTAAASGTAKSVTVSGLTAGKRYQCAVSAKNGRGLGPASAASNALTV